MKIKFSTEGQPIRGAGNPDSEDYIKVNEIFDEIVVDLPVMPLEGQPVSLAKDGIALDGVVDYAAICWHAKNNGIYRDDDEERCYCFVRLKDLEIIDRIDETLKTW